MHHNKIKKRGKNRKQLEKNKTPGVLFIYLFIIPGHEVAPCMKITQ